MAFLPFLKPKLLAFAVCSWCTSKTKFHSVWTARSIIVGIPNGLLDIPSAFGIHVRLTAFALYVVHLILPIAVIASYFCSSLLHKILSIPDVFLPLLVVTLLTAIALAEKLVVISLCIARISRSLAPTFKAPYNFACNSFNSRVARFQSIFFQLLTFSYLLVVL